MEFPTALSCFGAFLYVLLEICKANPMEHEDVDVCSLSSCAGPPYNNSTVAKYCDVNHLQMDGHCCLQSYPCKLAPDETIYQIVAELKETDFHCSDEEFRGFSNLSYLSLPSSCECPGGNSSWKSVDHNNYTTTCYDEKNICLTENYECPNNSSNSECVMESPGVPWCRCKDGYYGYKCLQKGQFPTILFVIALVGATSALSALLWVTQRRHVKKHQ